MPRKTEDLQKAWKIHIPATLAGKIEYMLLDPIHSQPLYGARGKLIKSLLEIWVATQEGQPVPPMPSILEVRS